MQMESVATNAGVARRAELVEALERIYVELGEDLAV